MPDAHVPIIVHLSGPRLGESQRVSGSRLVVGAARDAAIQLPEERRGSPADRHALLLSSGRSYRLRAIAPHAVWVNGQPVSERLLASGDLIELGENGPLLRYRLYAPGDRAKKSFAQAFADAYQAARNAPASALGAARLFVAGMLRDFRTEASPVVRIVSFAILAALITAIVVLSLRSFSLERRLDVETRQVEGLAALLDAERTTIEEFEEIRRDLERRLASATERLDVLEDRAGAVQRTVAEASRSVVFLQGSYGFRVATTGEPLRFALAADGRPLVDAEGGPAFTTEGEGPRVEAYFTGTGFIAGRATAMVTNRHVAAPWEFDADARRVVAQGFEPYMHRFHGYLFGREEPLPVRLELASDEVDLAVLTSEAAAEVGPLPLEAAPPAVGDTVLVLGFPTGIQAMMARADRDFLDRIAGRRLDFWQIARELAGAGQIAPLATRGIVGQVTASTVVYDAETTSGGSGGPVLDLEGRVVAVNSAVLRQFGGSNLGLPAAYAVELLDRLRGTE